MANDVLQQLIKWILGTIVGGLFFMVFIKYLYGSIRDYIKSFFIVRQLLKETRPTRNALKGKHLADRLLDIWNNGNPLPLVSRNVLYSRGQFWQGVWWESAVDKKLQEKGLVEIFEQSGQFWVKLSENRLTKMVIGRLLQLIKKGGL